MINDQAEPRVERVAPGEYRCGRLLAIYDEHDRAYHVYEGADIRRVGFVRNLKALERMAREEW